MDRKILIVSIMTILVLLGVFWVIAGVVSGGISSAWTLTNITTNGTAKNWTCGAYYTSNTSSYENLTFEFKLNHATAGHIDPDNITNITIRPGGLTNANGCTIDLGNLTTEVDAVNATYTSPAGAILSTNISCNVLYDNCTIQCLNVTKVNSALTGNGTYMVWAMIDANTTARESIIPWKIEVTDNSSNTSSLDAITSWGIDGLAPRLVEFNVSDSLHTWTSRDGTLDGTTAHTISNNSNILIRFIVNESNRAEGDVMLFWNDTTGADFVNLTGGAFLIENNTATTDGHGQVDLRRNGTCAMERTDVATQVCIYDHLINKTQFPIDSKVITFTVYMNDSFNQTTIANRFNVTIDGESPGATVTVTKAAVLNTQGEVTVSCAVADTNSTSEVTVEEITIIKPNGEKVTATDVASHIFRNEDTGLAGTYQAYCKSKDITDRTTESSRSEFTVYYRTGHAAGAGAGAGARIADVDISTTATPSGEISGKQGESQTFTIDGTTAHRLTFLTVGTNTATIQIESEKVEVTLSVGESKEVQVNGDAVKVTLNSITNGKASVTVVNVVKEAEALAEAEEVTGEEEVTTVAEKAGVSTWLIVLIIVVIVVIVYFVIKGKKGKKGEVKFSKKDLI